MNCKYKLSIGLFVIHFTGDIILMYLDSYFRRQLLPISADI